jgi:hypothetical protein
MEEGQEIEEKSITLVWALMMDFTAASNIRFNANNI